MSLSKLHTPSVAAPRAQSKTAAPRAKVKATVAETEVHSEEQIATSFEELFGSMKLPSGTRMAISVVTQFFVVAVGWFGALQFANLLVAAAMVMTSSMFLLYLIAFMTLALGLYASLMGAARIGKYIALGEIDDDAKRVKSWIGSKFSGIRARFN